MEAPRATGEPHHSQHHLEQTRVRAHIEMGLTVEKMFGFGKGRYRSFVAPNFRTDFYTINMVGISTGVMLRIYITVCYELLTDFL